jgi:hypothetical protein
VKQESDSPPIDLCLVKKTNTSSWVVRGKFFPYVARASSAEKNAMEKKWDAATKDLAHGHTNK